MGIKKTQFGKTKKGEKASLYTLTNCHGMEVVVSDYGATILRILVPDKFGTMNDIVLGYDQLSQYETNAPGYGSFIGRNANRIADGSFTLNQKTYLLEKNNGNNNLHSGTVSFNKYLYEAELYEEEGELEIEFSRLSSDMEQGFPGNLDYSVSYILTDDNELVIEYHAVSDQDTIVNFTNHSYFNLAGHASGDVLKHQVYIDSDSFTPTDESLIPTGEIREVTKTPMDFRIRKALGLEIEEDYLPLKIAGGYDHNYVLHTVRGDVKKVAELYEEASGRCMEVFTDMPGLQLYTGNFILGDETGKDGVIYQKRAGVCFETQFYPNACNTMEFPSSILRAGEEFDSVTIYRFSTK